MGLTSDGRSKSPITLRANGAAKRSSGRRTARQPEQLNVSGLPEPIEVRRHPKARRMTLRVSRTQRAVIMTLPEKCDLKQAGAFLQNHIDWVQERLGNLPKAEPFADGALIPLRGRPHRIVFGGRKRGRGVVEVGPDFDDGGVPEDAASEPTLTVFGDPEHAPRRLRDWLINEARKDLEAAVAVHADRLMLTPNRITIRDQVSRWGSCSSNGNLSFSWRLIMAPTEILDYVAAHEVAHLEEMNHGPRFWALVAKSCPGMDRSRAWLDHYGIELHRYGASEA
ncbi:MAG: SprT family zinc-dependent metalloprotease [Pseudomonadota bacterium]